MWTPRSEELGPVCQLPAQERSHLTPRPFPIPSGRANALRQPLPGTAGLFAARGFGYPKAPEEGPA